MGDTSIRWYSRIGTVTLPGPCSTHVGVGIGEAVSVGIKEGVAVPTGVLVQEGVKNWIGCNVGSGEVGVALGLETAPLHADNKNRTPTRTYILFISFT